MSPENRQPAERETPLKVERDLLSHDLLDLMGLAAPDVSNLIVPSITHTGVAVDSTAVVTVRAYAQQAGPAEAGAATAAEAGSMPAEAPGMMPGQPPANRRRIDPWLAFELGFGVTRTKDKLQFSTAVESRLFRDNLGRLVDVLGAAGATAIDDGLYPGTLSALHSPIGAWLGDASKSDHHQGVRRVGELPLRAGYSWMCELLPLLGREDLYLKLDFTKSWREGDNYPLTHQVIPPFLNPSDPRAQLRGRPFDGMGASHFVGMSGVEDGRNVVAATLPRSDPRAGVFGYDAIARPDDITDGQGNTILVIGSGKVIGGWVTAGGATIRGARTPHFDPITGFGSEGLPGGGAYVLMADGSTRVINGDIDEKVFRAMCTIHGADSVDEKDSVDTKVGETKKAETGGTQASAK